MNIGISAVRTKDIRLNRWELIEEIQKYGHNVFYFGMSNNKPPHTDYNKYGIEFISTSLKRSNVNVINELKTIRDYSKALKSKKIDSLLVYGIRTFPAVVIAAKLAGVKNVVCVVNGSGRLFKLKGMKGFITKLVSYPMLAYAFFLSNHIFFQNQDDLKLIKRKKLLLSTNYSVVNGSGVNLDEFPKVPLNKEPTFTYIGRITADKGVNEFIESALKVHEIYPEAKFYLVGPMDDSNKINNMLLKEAVDRGVIKLIGKVDDVRPSLKKTRVFVLPSFYGEGVPRTILEAMSMGRPIITTDSPGCRETVEDGVNGFKVPIKNTPKLIKKFLWMIENPEKAKEMGDNSRILAEEKFNVHNINKVMLKKLLKV